jgi:hypothetical protein
MKKITQSIQMGGIDGMDENDKIKSVIKQSAFSAE